MFSRHIDDLYNHGFTTISPNRLKAYKEWGFPLPKQPIIITFDNCDIDTLNAAAQIFEPLEMTGVVNLATTHIGNTPQTLNGRLMPTWDDIKKIKESKIFYIGGHTRNLVDLTTHVKPFNEIRASRHDIKKNIKFKSNVFSFPFGKFNNNILKDVKKAKVDIAFTYGNEIAVINRKTNLLALPRIRVTGGRLAFSTKIVSHAGSNSAGEVFVSQPDGPRFNAKVYIYEYGNYDSLYKEEFKELPTSITKLFSLPKNVKFPITVDITDNTGTILYMSSLFSKADLERGEPVIPSIELDEQSQEIIDGILESTEKDSSVIEGVTE